MGDHASHRPPAPVDRVATGEQRLEAATRARHLVAALLPLQRCAPTDLPRPR